MRRSLFCLLLLAISSGAIAQKSPIIRNVSRNLGATSGGTVLTLAGNNPPAPPVPSA